MKKTIIIIMLAIVSMATFAQKEPGSFTLYPRIGMNFSRMSNSELYEMGEKEDIEHKSHFKTGLVAGAELQYQINNILALSGGAFYSQQGEQFDDIEDVGTVKFHQNNLIIPICAVATTKYGISFRLGIQPEIKLSADDIMDKDFNFSIPLGLSYEYKNINLDLRYNLGLTDATTFTASKNRTIMLTIGYGVEF
jgi:hypothetical protein